MGLFDSIFKKDFAFHKFNHTVQDDLGHTS
jgi:hypothetical protein